MTYVNSVHNIEIDLANRISSAFHGFFGDIAKARMARRTMRELDALSNRELDDIGLHRAMIPAVARQSAFNI
ncbi:MAG: DUF1127 domain-containing protein [Paracoccaceae bacterium]